MWDTPIPEILVAMDAKAEWIKMTNPFGGGKKAEKPKPKTMPMAAFVDSVSRLPGTKVYGRE